MVLYCSAANSRVLARWLLSFIVRSMLRIAPYGFSSSTVDNASLPAMTKLKCEAVVFAQEFEQDAGSKGGSAKRNSINRASHAGFVTFGSEHHGMVCQTCQTSVTPRRSIDLRQSVWIDDKHVSEIDQCE